VPAYFTEPGPPPPSSQEIFNNWYRFSHNSGTNYPANASDVTASQWQFDAVNDEIVGLNNTGTAVGFVSDLKYSYYTLTSTLRSGQYDNDTIGIVLAFTTEGTPGQPDYREHTLTAFRTGGGTEGGRTWGVTYNAQPGVSVIIANGSTAVPTTGVWFTLGSTIVDVDRQGDTIIVKTSPFGSATLSAASTLTIDLTDATFVDGNGDPILERFRGPQAYGYMAYSQGDARFSGNFSGVSSTDNVVYDVISGKVYGSQVSPPYYKELVGAASFNDIAEPGRFYNNPDTRITTWKSSFDNNNYLIGGSGGGSQGVQGIQGTTGGGSIDCVDCDYDEPTDTNNSVAIHSKQSMYLFIDDNNTAGEDSNYFGFYNNLDPYSDTVNRDNTIFRIDEDGSVRTTNTIYATTSGIRFPDDAYGGSGDTAKIYLGSAGGEATQLTLEVTNDINDEIHLKVPDDDGVKINGYIVYHEGNHVCGNTGGGDGAGLSSRTNLLATTSSLADNASEDVNLTGFKGYAVYAITTDRAAWVRLYINAASRTADASRNELTDPDPDAGVILEVITNGAETVVISPAVFGYNGEVPATTNIPMTITNKSGSSGAVQVTVTALQLEV
jgi:hypothetical protein